MHSKITRAKFMKLMAPGTTWVFTHSRFPERGEQLRRVTKHAEKQVVSLGRYKSDSPVGEIWGPGSSNRNIETFTHDPDTGEVIAAVLRVVLTYRPANEAEIAAMDEQLAIAREGPEDGKEKQCTHSTSSMT